MPLVSSNKAAVTESGIEWSNVSPTVIRPVRFEKRPIVDVLTFIMEMVLLYCVGSEKPKQVLHRGNPPDAWAAMGKSTELPPAKVNSILK
ncbi:MAG: hypothetical protein OK422_04380 [Thaumarchaeota archaeon]|nr:hypothetical protein [Nitrososphaerota archaeon]